MAVTVGATARGAGHQSSVRPYIPSPLAQLWVVRVRRKKKTALAALAVMIDLTSSKRAGFVVLGVRDTRAILRTAATAATGANVTAPRSFHEVEEKHKRHLSHALSFMRL